MAPLSSNISYINKKKIPNESYQIIAFVQSRAILRLMKYTGLLIYHEENDRLEFHLWNISVLYGVAVYFTVMYYVISMIVTNVHIFMQKNCDSKCQAFRIVVFILSFQTILIPVLFWRRMTGLTDYFQSWYHFQLLHYNYSKKEITINVERMMKKLTYIAVFGSLFISIIICCCIHADDLTFKIFSTYFLICFSTNISISFWFGQCILIQSAAKNFQRFFQQLIGSVESTSQDIISICFEMWISLNNIVKSLTNNFSFLITSLCFCSFLSTLITMYCFVSQIFLSSKTNTLDVDFTIMNLLLSVWTFSLQHILNDSSYNTSKQVDFRKWIITTNLNGLQENLQDQILELLSYFENQIPRIGLFGFEFLSREFIITISSTLITYIIIILQFQNSGVHSSTNISSRPNCTSNIS